MAKDEEDANLIHRASEKGFVQVLEIIKSLNPNADFNCLSKFGSPICFAISADKDESFEYLLENNVDLSISDRNEDNALLLCIKSKQHNMFASLVKYVALSTSIDINAKKNLFNKINNDGNTLLHEIAFSSSLQMLNYIMDLPIEYTTDQSILNKNEQTYKDIIESLESNRRDMEKLEKEKKAIIKKEKEQMEMDRKRQIEEEREERRREEERDQKNEEIGLTMLRYRTHIFVAVFVIVFGFIFLWIKNASVKKEKII